MCVDTRGEGTQGWPCGCILFHSFIAFCLFLVFPVWLRSASNWDHRHVTQSPALVFSPSFFAGDDGLQELAKHRLYHQTASLPLSAYLLGMSLGILAWDTCEFFAAVEVIFHLRRHRGTHGDKCVRTWILRRASESRYRGSATKGRSLTSTGWAEQASLI